VTVSAGFVRVLGVLRTRTFMFALVLAVALFVANLIVQANFVSSSALPETLADLAPFAIVAMASAPSVVTGGLDLSVGPVLSLTNIMMVAVLLPHGLGGPGAAIPILLALGAAVGALSGALIAYLRLPAIITGLCACSSSPVPGSRSCSIPSRLRPTGPSISVERSARFPAA
jgi:ribose transport system permease protein